MTSIENLMKDHQLIEEMLKTILLASQKLKSNETLPPTFLSDILKTIKIFIEPIHFDKEEKALFPTLENRGLPMNHVYRMAVEETRIMCTKIRVEHKESKELREKIEETYNKPNTEPKQLIDTLLDYANHLIQHILKEDRILFQLANRILHDFEQRPLIEKFYEIEEQLDDIDIYNNLANLKRAIEGKNK